jgi:hypothetical protein
VFVSSCDGMHGLLPVHSLQEHDISERSSTVSEAGRASRRLQFGWAPPSDLGGERSVLRVNAPSPVFDVCFVWVSAERGSAPPSIPELRETSEILVSARHNSKDAAGIGDAKCVGT